MAEISIEIVGLSGGSGERLLSNIDRSLSDIRRGMNLFIRTAGIANRELSVGADIIERQRNSVMPLRDAMGRFRSAAQAANRETKTGADTLKAQRPHVDYLRDEMGRFTSSSSSANRQWRGISLNMRKASRSLTRLTTQAGRFGASGITSGIAGTQSAFGNAFGGILGGGGVSGLVGGAVRAPFAAAQLGTDIGSSLTGSLAKSLSAGAASVADSISSFPILGPLLGTPTAAAGAAVGIAGAAIQGVGGGAAQLIGAAGRLGGGIAESLVGGLSKGLVVGGAITANSIRQGLNLENASRAFDDFVLRGNDGTEVLRDFRVASRETIPDVELMRQATRGLASGAVESSEQFEVLLRGADRLGRFVRGGPTEALERLTLAINTRQRRLVDDLTIVTNAVEANDRYAASIGKSTADLTENERVIAFRQEILRSITDRLEILGPAVEGVDTRFRQFQTSVTNLSTEWGQVFLPVLDLGLKAITPIVEESRMWVELNRDLISEKVTGFFESLPVLFSAAGNALESLVSQISEFIGFDYEKAKSDIGSLSDAAFSEFVLPNSPLSPADLVARRSAEFGAPGFGAAITKAPAVASGSTRSTLEATFSSVFDRISSLINGSGVEPVTRIDSVLRNSDRLGGPGFIDPLSVSVPEPKSIFDAIGRDGIGSTISFGVVEPISKFFSSDGFLESLQEAGKALGKGLIEASKGLFSNLIGEGNENTSSSGSTEGDENESILSRINDFGGASFEAGRQKFDNLLGDKFAEGRSKVIDFLIEPATRSRVPFAGNLVPSLFGSDRQVSEGANRGTLKGSFQPQGTGPDFASTHDGRLARIRADGAALREEAKRQRAIDREEFRRELERDALRIFSPFVAQGTGPPVSELFPSFEQGTGPFFEQGTGPFFEQGTGPLPPPPSFEQGSGPFFEQGPGPIFEQGTGPRLDSIDGHLLAASNAIGIASQERLAFAIDKTLEVFGDFGESTEGVNETLNRFANEFDTEVIRPLNVVANREIRLTTEAIRENNRILDAEAAERERLAATLEPLGEIANRFVSEMDQIADATASARQRIEEVTRQRIDAANTQVLDRFNGAAELPGVSLNARAALRRPERQRRRELVRDINTTFGSRGFGVSGPLPGGQFGAGFGSSFQPLGRDFDSFGTIAPNLAGDTAAESQSLLLEVVRESQSFINERAAAEQARLDEIVSIERERLDAVRAAAEARRAAEEETIRLIKELLASEAGTVTELQELRRALADLEKEKERIERLARRK